MIEQQEYPTPVAGLPENTPRASKWPTLPLKSEREFARALIDAIREHTASFGSVAAKLGGNHIGNSLYCYLLGYIEASAELPSGDLDDLMPGAITKRIELRDKLVYCETRLALDVVSPPDFSSTEADLIRRLCRERSEGVAMSTEDAGQLAALYRRLQ